MSQNPNTNTSNHLTGSSTCPSWCRADHEHQGDESDRWHHSAVTELPLVELTRPTDHPHAKMADTAVAFDVALEQPWGSPNIYVMLGVGSERTRTFCLTLESVERLITALEDTVRIGRRSA